MNVKTPIKALVLAAALASAAMPLVAQATPAVPQAARQARSDQARNDRDQDRRPDSRNDNRQDNNRNPRADNNPNNRDNGNRNTGVTTNRYGTWRVSWGARPSAPPRSFRQSSDWYRHVRACQVRYRSYNPATDRYTVRRGQTAICRL